MLRSILAVSFLVIITAVFVQSPPLMLIHTPDTERYQQEELNVYNATLDTVLDTRYWNAELKRTGEQRVVFSVIDSLRANTCNSAGAQIQVAPRRFAVGLLRRSPRYRFWVSQRLPFLREANSSVANKKAAVFQLQDGEIYSWKWIILSRVCFDLSLTEAHFNYTNWCGDLCVSGGTLILRKIGQKWVVIKAWQAPVA